MEYEDSSKIIGQDFDFLNDSHVAEHFADINTALLNGRHMQQGDGLLFQTLSDRFVQFNHYYESLYGLTLEKSAKDNATFYYLDFTEGTQTKVSSSNRSRQLTQRETIIGVMLLNMYLDQYFNEVKEVHWSAIESEITEGKNSNLYKKLFFGEVRDFYSKQEWGQKKNNFRQTIRVFNKLGWVEQCSPALSDDKDNIHFILQPSIHRLATLYKHELENFNDFVESYYKSKNP